MSPALVRVPTSILPITGISANAHPASTRLYEVITHETPTIEVENRE